MSVQFQPLHLQRHEKWHGFVEHIERSRWWARLDVDGHDLMAEMTEPLPPHAKHGSLFTIHRTKRGQVYLYWITRPLITKRRVKKARIWARDARRRLRIDAP